MYYGMMNMHNYCLMHVTIVYIWYIYAEFSSSLIINSFIKITYYNEK